MKKWNKPKKSLLLCLLPKTPSKSNSGILIANNYQTERKSNFFSFTSIIVLSTLLIIALSACSSKKPPPYRAIAYVTVPASENWRWIGSDGDVVISDVDVSYVTHINFAFGMLKAYQFEEGTTGEPLKDGRIVSREAFRNPADGQYHYSATLTGWIEEMNSLVDGRAYLSALVDLKEKKPELKVLLSIGGWDSDGFCYMAQTREGREQFIESCIDLIMEYNLDGIDLDWEYPTNGAWGEIAWCDNCVEDARKLIKEFRSRLDSEFTDKERKLLTIAAGAGQPWVDSETMTSLDYINVMCYDFKPGTGGSQADLESSKIFMAMHTSMVGDTPENRAKINLGVPFYNEGGAYLVPFYKEWSGHVDASPEIIKEKMEWVKNNGYGGCFYWAYSMDVFEQDVADPNSPEIKILQRTVYNILNLENTPTPTPSEKNKKLGEYSENLYINDYLGFSLEIPTGWHVYSDDMIGSYITQSLNSVKQLDIAGEKKDLLIRQVENSSILFMATHTLPQDAGGGNIVFIATCEDISHYDGLIKDEAGYIKLYAEISEILGNSVKTSDEKINGTNFSVTTSTSSSSGMEISSESYIKMTDDYVLSFNYVYYNDVGRQNLDIIKNSIKFD